MNINIPSGILPINKPSGITSHDVIDLLRKVLRKTKIGHSGTLDPMATGVMNVLIGNGTKLSEVLTNNDKKYAVKMLLGVKTDTYDITGNILTASPVIHDEVYIRERIKRFIGKQKQVPPIHSAIRVDGKRAYEYAREGKELTLSAREIEIYDIYDIKVDLETKIVSFTVHCSKGTYIRSLVNDIGEKIGSHATMSELCRLSSGSTNIEKSEKLYDFLKLDLNHMTEQIIPIEQYFIDSKAVYLNELEYVKFENGILLDIESRSNIVRVYENKQYRGLGKIEDNKLKRFIIE